MTCRCRAHLVLHDAKLLRQVSGLRCRTAPVAKLAAVDLELCAWTYLSRIRASGISSIAEAFLELSIAASALTNTPARNLGLFEPTVRAGI